MWVSSGSVVPAAELVNAYPILTFLNLTKVSRHRRATVDPNIYLF
jgi:hypothetical protein